MNIYFSCSITGGRKDQQIYQEIVDCLVELGHEVPTAHLSKAEVIEDERVVSALDVYASGCQLGQPMRSGHRRS